MHMEGLPMRRKILFWVVSVCILVFTRIPAFADEWDAGADVVRLSREAPSSAAFSNAYGIVWLSSYNYKLRPDGGMEKRHRLLVMLADNWDGEALDQFVIPCPPDPGSTVEIAEASWYVPSSGEKAGSLDVRYYDENGVSGAEVIIPKEAGGCVVAVDSFAINPKKYYLDDLLVLAGSAPIWEQRIEVEIPEEMDFYWQGIGIRAPERSAVLGVERITWTMMNQPAWVRSGLLDEHPPTLVFSLHKGFSSSLRELRDLENSFIAPPIPLEISSAGAGGSLQKVGERIAAFVRENMISYGAHIPAGVRDRSFIGDRGPWTVWEGTLIAAKWLQSMGYDSKIFWSQRMPVGQDGPDAKLLWGEPVLVINRGGTSDIYFTAGQTAEFGRLKPSLYGASIYRGSGREIQKIILPRGSASDHTLAQLWRLTLGENGVAKGSLDITATGRWADILAMGRAPSLESAGAGIQDKIIFGIRGISLDIAAVTVLGNGYRLSFGVSAPLGIVYGSDILMKIPGGIPSSFADIPADHEEFSFNFPFVFDQNVIISTPKGFRALAVPAKTQHGDGKAMFNESIAHWAKKARIEASSKWTVRSAAVDLALVPRILDQLAMARGWSELTIPLRK
jgi:hypothetical protein